MTVADGDGAVVIVDGEDDDDADGDDDDDDDGVDEDTPPEEDDEGFGVSGIGPGTAGERGEEGLTRFRLWLRIGAIGPDKGKRLWVSLEDMKRWDLQYTRARFVR